jgi:hypothetical protein
MNEQHGFSRFLFGVCVASGVTMGMASVGVDVLLGRLIRVCETDTVEERIVLVDADERANERPYFFAYRCITLEKHESI